MYASPGIQRHVRGARMQKSDHVWHLTLRNTLTKILTSIHENLMRLSRENENSQRFS